MCMAVKEYLRFDDSSQLDVVVTEPCVVDDVTSPSTGGGASNGTGAPTLSQPGTAGWLWEMGA